jgi:hypothetical protein
MGNFSWDCNVCGRSLRGTTTNPVVRSKAWGGDAVLVPNRGDRLEGDYDGYGRVGGTPILDEWDDDEGPYLRSEIQRTRDQLADPDLTPVGGYEARPEDSPALAEARTFLRSLRDSREQSIARMEARLKEIEPTEIQFTAYHRRCWEGAGRPGFRGQSPGSRDQGNW